MFNIGGIQKSTLLDYPEKIAAIVFTQGCNFRCGYCHNPELLNFSQNSDYCAEDFLSFLKTRINKLDGIVIGGGEPSLQTGLYDFIKQIKDLNFCVKLDTNGTNPKILKKLISEKLVDYIAMDIKAPLEKYEKITNSKIDTDKISESINLIIHSGIDYEFRTTVIKSQLSLEDFDRIGQMISGAKKYYLQKFLPSKIYDKTLANQQTYTDSEFNNICMHLKKYIQFVAYR